MNHAALRLVAAPMATKIASHRPNWFVRTPMTVPKMTHRPMFQVFTLSSG